MDTAVAHLDHGRVEADDADPAGVLPPWTEWWPTTTLPGGHLHMLTDPAGVAVAVTESLRVLREPA